MRLPWKRDIPLAIDYSDVVDRLCYDLELLAKSIERRDVAADSARVVSEIRHAVRLLRKALEFEPSSMTHQHPDGHVLYEWSRQNIDAENRAWSDAWEYIGRHIRGWWD